MTARPIDPAALPSATCQPPADCTKLHGRETKPDPLPVGAALGVDGLVEVLENLRPEPRRCAWRTVVGTWPPALRHEWAELSVQFEAAGTPWPGSERLAAVEVARLQPDPEALLFGHQAIAAAEPGGVS